MVAVIFEAIPRAGQWDEYLDLASTLKPLLSNVDGFISVERYQSLATEGKVLSLSFWENEESVAQWRNVEMHRHAQQEGRNSIFSNYRIRIATVMRDYGMTEREQAPADSKIVNH